MKNKASIFGLYLPLFVLSTLSACVFRTLALLFDFDVISGYFDDKLFIRLADGFAVGGAVILLTFLINGKRNIKLIAEFSNAPTLFASVPVLGAFIFFGTYALKRLFSFIKVLKELNPQNGKITAIALTFCVIFAAVAICYFAFNIILSKHKMKARAVLAMLSTLFFASYVAYLYFNTSLPLNAPNKLVDEMAYLFLAVFFLYEARLALGRALWRGYIAFGLTGALLTAYSAIPSIIYYMVEKRSVSNSIYESVLTLSLFIFILVRTLMTGELIIDKVSPKMQLIIDAADERATELKTSGVLSKDIPAAEELGDQIAISDIADIDATAEDERMAEEAEIQKLELIDQIEQLSTQEDG